MSNEIVNGSELLCRACLKSSTETTLISLCFMENNVSGFQTISDLFSTYTYLDIDDEEEFMPYICVECYEFLLNFHKYREMCVNSHFELLKMKYSVTECFVSLNRVTGFEALPSPEAEASVEEIAFDNLSNDSKGVEDSELVLVSPEFQINDSDESDLCETNDEEFGANGNFNDTAWYTAHMQDPSSLNLTNNDIIHTSKNINDILMLTRQAKEYLCAFCSTICVGIDGLDKHRYEKHYILRENDVYSCGFCNEKFRRSADIKQHMPMHVGEERTMNQNWQPTAEKQYSTPSTFSLSKSLPKVKKKPVKSAMTEENLVCLVCGIATKSKHVLRQHMNIHTKKKKYACEFCATIYFSSSGLYSHRLKIHHIQRTNGWYKCRFCNEAYSCAKDVKNHMATHTEVPTSTEWHQHGQSAESNEIEMISSESDDEKQENEIHIANDLLIDQNNAMRGERHSILVEIETAEDSFESMEKGEFPCEFCMNEFICKSSLRNHRNRIHHINKLNEIYFCTFCKKTSLEPRDIQLHMLMHTGQNELES